MTSVDPENDSLVRIPVFNAAELAMVESLLQASDTFYVSLPGDHEITGPRLLVRISDLPDVKELLADFRIQTPTGRLVPIPW